MKKIIAGLLLFLVALPAFGAELKIGYVDLTRVLDSYQRRSTLEQKLKDIQATLTEQDRTRIEAIAKAEQELEQLAMGSPERQEMDAKYRKLISEAEEFRRRGHETLNNEYVTMLESMFKDILDEVALIAEERQYDFIIKDQTAAEKAASRPDAILQISQRVVLYAKAEYDLTDEIIKRMNDKYAAKTENKPAEAAPSK